MPHATLSCVKSGLAIIVVDDEILFRPPDDPRECGGCHGHLGEQWLLATYRFLGEVEAAAVILRNHHRNRFYGTPQPFCLRPISRRAVRRYSAANSSIGEATTLDQISPGLGRIRGPRVMTSV